MRTTAAACLIVLLATAWCVEANCQTLDFGEEDQDADKRAEIDYLKARIADETASLRRLEELHKREGRFLDEISRDQIWLKRSQVALAREQDDGPRLLQLLRELVSLLEEQVRRVEKFGESGATAKIELLAVRADLADDKAELAEAAREGAGYDRRKFLATLEAALAARQAEIDEIRRTPSVYCNPEMRLRGPQYSLRKARIRLAEAEGDRTALVRLRAGRVQDLEREFERMQDLYDQRAISKELLAAAERRLKQARRDFAEAQRRVGGSSDSSDTRAPHSRMP